MTDNHSPSNSPFNSSFNSPSDPTVNRPATSDNDLPPTPTVTDEVDEIRSFLGRAGRFVLVGICLYLAVYLGAEWLVYQTAERNRFFTVKTAAMNDYDHVILGASHAAVFDYRDLNTRLEQMTGADILNLATEGSGVLLNRVLLEYFYATGHTSDTVVYVVDSFAFYSPEWNEVRLQDAELYARAPFDPALTRILLGHPAGRPVLLDYLTGFSKINNADRFAPDLFAAEGPRFDRVYRPLAQIDRQRMAFLYPADIDADTLQASPYLAAFTELIDYVQARGDRFIIVRPPVPSRIYQMIPFEPEFDRTLRQVAEQHDVELHDFTAVNNDPGYFYDSDHLNQAGALQFLQRYLGPVLQEEED